MTKPRTPEEIADKLLRDLGLVFDPHEKEDLRLILAALREAAEAGGLEALQRPRESLGKATCGHDSYWRTHYGDCMACQRVTAEARVAELERKLAEETERREAAELDFEREHTRCEKAEAEAQWQKERGENNTLAHAAEIERLRAEREELVTAVRELLEHVETENADVIGAIQAAWLALTPRS